MIIAVSLQNWAVWTLISLWFVNDSSFDTWLCFSKKGSSTSIYRNSSIYVASENMLMSTIQIHNDQHIWQLIFKVINLLWPSVQYWFKLIAGRAYIKLFQESLENFKTDLMN